MNVVKAYCRRKWGQNCIAYTYTSTIDPTSGHAPKNALAPKISLHNNDFRVSRLLLAKKL